MLSELVEPGLSNVLTLSSARRDKWQMAVALRTAEVPHLRQISSDRVDEVSAWLRREGLEDAPIVLKPQASGGADDVFVAMPGDDWREKFNRILGCVNKLNIRNDKVLVQELAERRGDRAAADRDQRPAGRCGAATRAMRRRIGKVPWCRAPMT